MIKDLGNCGNPQKLERIMSAVQSAQENKCCLVIFLDPLVYGKNSFMITSENIQEVSFAQHNDELLVIRDSKVVTTFAWWDIYKVRVIWWYEQGIQLSKLPSKSGGSCRNPRNNLQDYKDSQSQTFWASRIQRSVKTIFRNLVHSTAERCLFKSRTNMKVGDIIQLPTLEEMGYKGRTVQSQSIRFNRRCSDKERIKFLEGKTIVAGEVIDGTQIFKIKRD